MPYFGNGAQNAVLALYCFLVFGTGELNLQFAAEESNVLNQHHEAAQFHPLVELRVELRTISTLSATDAQMLRTWRSR